MAPPADGRVHGGALSYPRLAARGRRPLKRTGCRSDATCWQTVTIEPNYKANSSWVASVLVGELVAGDGFFSPQQGSEIVVK